MESVHRDPEQQVPEPVQPSNQYPENSDKMPSPTTGDSTEDAPSPALNGNAQASATPAALPERTDIYAEQVQNVVTSDIGVQILLNRLKQSLASAKEFALFLQKRSKLEEEHASGLRKISRISYDSLRRPEHRQGSFIASYDEITRIHERMADNGTQFAASLHQMHEDMLEMAANVERGRKHWKTVGLAAEQRLVDAETAMRKSKAKYDTLAEDYDRARTGDRQATKKFGLKGPKSAAQHEEDLLRKAQAADADYYTKVQTAQATRQEHLSKSRPEAVKSLQDLIKECDSALTLQMQKFASFSEKLLLHDGMSVSPLKGHPNESGKSTRSLREAIADINNDGDLSYFIASYSSQVPARQADIAYERNPVLHPAAPPAVAVVQPQKQSEPSQTFNSFNSRQGLPGAPTGTSPHPSPMGSGPNFNQGPPPAMQQHQQYQQHERSFSQNGPPTSSSYNQASVGRAGNGNSLPHPPPSTFISSGPPQLQTLPFQTSTPLSQSFQQSASPVQQAPVKQQQAPQPYASQQPSQPYGGRSSVADPSNLPPLKPVFGLTLDQLFERDGSAVPMVVYQCIQAVDLYGLEVEGIYRISGTGSHVNKIKAMFDNDASKLDFRNPEAFFLDVNSVASLLKQFFRDLPDPLLTSEHYAAFIDAAKIDDDVLRRDSLHAIINALPDPNYATLRAVTLHLHRVVENAATNRMNASNLAIVWGPTLMGAGAGGRIQDAGWQVRVVQTVVENCYQIFDED